MHVEESYAWNCCIVILAYFEELQLYNSNKQSLLRINSSFTIAITQYTYNKILKPKISLK